MACALNLLKRHKNN